MAYIGSVFSFCLPPSITGQPPQIQSAGVSKPYIPFGGSGNRLADGAETSAPTNNTMNKLETASERRERALQAVQRRLT